MSVDRTRPGTDDAELRVEFTDPVTHARGYAFIDSLTNVAYGGVRASLSLTPEPLFQLARQRTLRYQLARVPLAGAALGLVYDPAAPDFPDLLGRFFNALRPLIESVVSLGPDANVPTEMLESALANAHLPWRGTAMQQKQGWSIERWQRAQELAATTVDGEDSLRVVEAALSVAHAATTAADSLFHRELTVAVIGTGPFALRIARCLQHVGARVVAVGDRSAAVHAKNGLAPAILSAPDLMTAELGDALYITGDELFGLPVDVMVAASNDDQIAIENVGRLRCGLVVEAAAQAVSSNGETVLIARGIPVLPSFAATAGPVFVTDAVLRGTVDSAETALAHLTTNMQTTARELIRLSATLRIPLREAALRLAFHHRFGKQPVRQLSRRMQAVSDDGTVR